MEIEILQFAKNEHGLIINQPDVLAKLKAVIKNPCEETWEDAYDIVLDGMSMNLWQAVLWVNPNFSDCKIGEDWDEIPCAWTVSKAVKLAIFMKGEFIQN